MANSFQCRIDLGGFVADGSRRSDRRHPSIVTRHHQQSVGGAHRALIAAVAGWLVIR
jgi:hypothetical protein